jgi:hypothetical protein
MIAADTGTLVNGAWIGPFNLNGLGAARYGARLRGFARGHAKLHVRAIRDFAVSLEESADGLYDTFFNDFFLGADENHASTRNAVCLSFPKAAVSGGLHDVNGNNFYNYSCIHQDGIGVDLQEGYMNNFYLTQLFSTGNSWAIRFGGSGVNGFQRAHGNNFYDLITNQAPILSEGGTYPAMGNTIDPLDTQSIVPSVTIGSGSTLYCTTNGSNSPDQGRNSNFCTSRAFGQLAAGNPTAITDTANYRILAVNTFTPHFSGNMSFAITGGLFNSTNGSGAFVTGYYGTGTPPVNGDLASTAGSNRFQCGGFPVVVNPAGTTMKVPFSVSCSVQNVNRSIPWWYALAGKVITSGSLAPENVYLEHREEP